MRINRQRSNLRFRQPPRRGGYLTFLIVLGLVAGGAFLARDWLARWLIINQPWLEADLSAGEAAFLRGDLDAAIEMARSQLLNDPTHGEWLSLLVRALVYRSYVDYDGQIDRATALQYTTAALATATRDLDVIAAHAYALQASQQSREASQFALRVIERHRDHIGARLALSLAYRSQGLFEASLREARYALPLAEQMGSGLWQMEAWRAIAIAQSDLGRYQEALDAIDQGLAFSRRLIPLHFERALYALQIGNTDAATVAYFQVVAFDDQNAKARLRLCELSSSLRERDAAIRYCTELTQLAPAWSEAWYQLGREHYLRGDFTQAQQAMNRCTTLQQVQNVPISERRLECWYIQGQAAEVRGDCEGLMATYTEFQAMVATANLPQTWVYPPEGPPICATE